jgi:hypothetical protein
MEFAACENCNKGTGAADLVASFMARIGRDNGEGDWQIAEAGSRKGAIRKFAPGLLEEIFHRGKMVWSRGPSGLVRPYVTFAEGPLLYAYLTVFAAKMGMALYREHCGAALPLEGGVQTQYFLNGASLSRPGKRSSASCLDWKPLSKASFAPESSSLTGTIMMREAS